MGSVGDTRGDDDVVRVEHAIGVHTAGRAEAAGRALPAALVPRVRLDGGDVGVVRGHRPVARLTAVALLVLTVLLVALVLPVTTVVLTGVVLVTAVLLATVLAGVLVLGGAQFTGGEESSPSGRSPTRSMAIAIRSIVAPRFSFNGFMIALSAKPLSCCWACTEFCSRW